MIPRFGRVYISRSYVRNITASGIISMFIVVIVIFIILTVIIVCVFETRWLTLLLSQEFPLPDVMRIWDSLFADENRFSFLIHICCAMIL